MRLAIWLWLLVVVCGVAAADDESSPTFRSDVALGRIDALVMDRSQRLIGGLTKEDFLLRKSGKQIPIHSVAHEDLPVDVLLLLDVSGSMGVHVQKVASAAHDALAVLGDQDRVGVMVFTTSARLRLPFEPDLSEVEHRLDDIVDSEHFNGGTNINSALLDAAAYMERNGRKQVRHAVVIVTDDQAPRCDQARVLAALDRADAVLMVLLAPSVAIVSRPPAGRPPVATPWPGAGGAGGPLGGVILGRRRGPGSPPVIVGYPGGMSAGAPAIARASGGDSLNVNDASAVETTFERIRHRYAIYFYLPDGLEDGHGVELDLAEMARRKHSDATLQYRQAALAKEGARPVLITRVPAHPPSGRDPEPEKAESSDASSTPKRRRPAVNDSTGPRIALPAQAQVEVVTVADQERTPVTIRHRGISEPHDTTRVILVTDP